MRMTLILRKRYLHCLIRFNTVKEITAGLDIDATIKVPLIHFQYTLRGDRLQTIDGMLLYGAVV